MRANKNRKKVIIAVIAGALPAIGVFNMINSQKSQIDQLTVQLSQAQAAASSKPIAAPTQQVDLNETTILAKKDIKAGELITIDKIERTQYRKTDLPQNYFNNENFVLGKIASQNILQGKIITSDDILNVDPNLLNIPPGMRAITIPSTYFQGLASYMYAGAKVDIISVPAKGSPEFIAQNVKIIAMEEIPNPMAASAPAPTPPPPMATPPATPATPGAPSVPGATTQPTTPAPTPAVLQPSPIKTNLSADKAAAITVLIPISVADRVVDAMINGKLMIVTRGRNDDKIVHSHISSSDSVPKLNLPPPPSISTKLPTLPGPDFDEDIDEPKTRVEIYVGKNKEDHCYDDKNNKIKCTDTKPKSNDSWTANNSTLPPAPPSKSLSDLLKSIK